jgi:hypothetical protein
VLHAWRQCSKTPAAFMRHDLRRSRVAGHSSTGGTCGCCHTSPPPLQGTFSVTLDCTAYQLRTVHPNQGMTNTRIDSKSSKKEIFYLLGMLLQKSSLDRKKSVPCCVCTIYQSPAIYTLFNSLVTLIQQISSNQAKIFMVGGYAYPTNPTTSNKILHLLGLLF